MLGVVKLVPVPSDEPPVELAYQLIVPAEAVAPKVTVPVPHVEPGVVVRTVGLSTVTDTILENASRFPFEQRTRALK